MEHQFNIEIAKIVGVNAAIIFKNISHWCEKNKVNNKHFYDDEFWTYNSIKAFEDLFPYLSNKQIRSALDKLKEFGLIDFGEYNNNPYDRTRWYCDKTQKIGLISFTSSVLKGKMDTTKMANVDLPKRVSSITDNKLTNINTDNKHLNINKEHSSFCVNQVNLFDIEEPDIKSNTKAIKGKKEAHPSHNLIKNFWFEEYMIGSRFQIGDGTHINRIIENIDQYLKKNNWKNDPDSILEFFKILCKQKSLLKNSFHATASLSTLGSSNHFTSIIENIKLNSNGQSNINSRQHKDYVRQSVSASLSSVPDPRK